LNGLQRTQYGTTGTTTFGYDWADRVISTTAPAAYATATITTAFRIDGLLAARAYPGDTRTVG
jgi:hypothetical protein